MVTVMKKFHILSTVRSKETFFEVSDVFVCIERKKFSSQYDIINLGGFPPKDLV
jgi:hypothetical protein